MVFGLSNCSRKVAHPTAAGRVVRSRKTYVWTLVQPPRACRSAVLSNRRGCRSARAEGHRHMADAGVFVGTGPLYRAGQGETLQPIEQFVEDAPDLHPGQIGPQAEVGAIAEGEMRVRVPPDIKTERVLEDRPVAIGRRPPQRHLVTLANRVPVELRVPGGRTSVVQG